MSGEVGRLVLDMEAAGQSEYFGTLVVSRKAVWTRSKETSSQPALFSDVSLLHRGCGCNQGY